MRQTEARTKKSYKAFAQQVQKKRNRNNEETQKENIRRKHG